MDSQSGLSVAGDEGRSAAPAVDEPPADLLGVGAAQHAGPQEDPSPQGAPQVSTRRSGGVRRVAMRPRRALVKVHRWLAFALMAWVIVICITGGWLVSHHAVQSWFQRDRYATTPGDQGPDAAARAVQAEIPEGSKVTGLALPGNGRGVYRVYVEEPIVPPAAADAESADAATTTTLAEPADGEAADGGSAEAGTEADAAEGEEAVAEPRYLTAFVDPGSARVNEIVDEEAGISWWLYRGHMYLWQDHGLLGAFDPASGWCRATAEGVEPGGVKGVVCDVLPDGEDMVAYLGLGWIVVLLTGFYLWYWPGVRRWATALLIRRNRGAFAFNMSVHKVVGLVVWLPLTVVAFTGAAFAFPNMKAWYQNVTPAGRGVELWVTPEGAETSGDAAGREPIGLDGAEAAIQSRYPERTVEYLGAPADETGTYAAWVTRGFSPWTREGGAGNVYVVVDQYDGSIRYDGTPEEHGAFDQLWDDWSFPLHTGDILGTPSRVLWVLLAFSPLVLVATGISMNLIRRSKRRNRVAITGSDPSGPGGSGSGEAEVEAEVLDDPAPTEVLPADAGAIVVARGS